MSDKPDEGRLENKMLDAAQIMKKSLNPKAPPMEMPGSGVGATQQPKAPPPDTTGKVSAPLPPASED